MRALFRFGYGAAGQFVRALSAIAPDGDSKLRRALRARRGIRQRYARWGETGRDATRALLWMHAPSVGEGLQARPVLQLARNERPDLQLAYTFFSPSAVPFARALDVDFADFLPFDTRGDAIAALEALRPRALVFSKLDVWPMLARVAHARGVRLGLISATLASGSSRRGGMAARFLRDAYAVLDAVGAIDAADADRLAALGVHADRVQVTGDTRYDQVWARMQHVDRHGALLAPLASDRPTLVAGSTWPADERVLLDAWIGVRSAVPAARLIIAPHEPTPAHTGPLEDWARDARLRVARLTTAGPDDDVIVVDRVGVLGEVYALADVAYVGGGFHDAGLHSVLEPAAFGAPVVFGPRHNDSRDAGLLLVAGGGFTVPESQAMATCLTSLLGAGSARRQASDAARAVVERGLGAAQRSWQLVSRLLAD
jgi:3-deoxy-D-manno-octulosonic-acid transferase